MTKKKKPGFNGQFVETLAVGTYTDMNGNRVEVTPDYLKKLATNYNPALHEAPAVIGHPETDAPAYGWVRAVRVNGDKLEVQFADTDPEFEEMVRKGLFKKRSLKIYNDPKKFSVAAVPYIGHVGFLGAAPPAVKGLKNIHFNEAPGVEIEVAGDITFSEGDTVVDAKERAELEKTIGEKIAEFFKGLAGGKDDKPATTFSEADVRTLVKDAVAAVETKFSAQITDLENKNKKLQEKVDHQGNASQRASIVKFLDSVGAERILPAFRNSGVIEFMESLAASEVKVEVATLAEENGKEVEKKVQMQPLEWFQSFLKSLPAFVRLGEQFGDLKLSGDGSEIVDPKQIDALRSSMGVKPAEAAAAK
jgi:hypothetical protein